MRPVTTDQAIEFLNEISGFPGIHAETTFGELGLDSLGLIEWITMLEEHLAVDLDVRSIDFRLFDDKSIAAVLDVIHQHAADN
ncbi:MAG: hypothetical protein AUI14_01975 [Actinobacteria bacterium 13_2_20CM_2_71_6]|jgi:acyl carrier protein|nr:MAG: hypothetical protein AUI14_01975 [Actinobacteria bacterium 13_2_20CM_2_71_6]